MEEASSVEGGLTESTTFLRRSLETERKEEEGKGRSRGLKQKLDMGAYARTTEKNTDATV